MRAPHGGDNDNDNDNEEDDMDDDSTTTPDPAIIRAAARAAARAARAEEEALAQSRLRAAAELLADARAGVPGRDVYEPVRRALQVAAARAEGARARALLEGARVIQTAAAFDLSRRGSWARQGGEFLRAPGQLRVGSYVTGRQGRPRDPTHYYVLLALAEEDVLVEVTTEAEAAGELAAAELADAWRRVVEGAEEIERAEVGEVVDEPRAVEQLRTTLRDPPVVAVPRAAVSFGGGSLTVSVSAEGGEGGRSLFGGPAAQGAPGRSGRSP